MIFLEAPQVVQMVKNLPAMQEFDLGFDPCFGRIPWRREWLSTLVPLLRELHGQRSLVRLQSMGSQSVGHN